MRFVPKPENMRRNGSFYHNRTVFYRRGWMLQSTPIEGPPFEDTHTDTHTQTDPYSSRCSPILIPLVVPVSLWYDDIQSIPLALIRDLGFIQRSQEFPHKFPLGKSKETFYLNTHTWLQRDTRSGARIDTHRDAQFGFTKNHKCF